MSRLDDVTLDELHGLLERVEGKKPAQRVLAAIGRKQGDTLDTLAERHGVTERTVRNWLDRFAERPTERAPYDENRPGRPPKLSDEERATFFAHLRELPGEFGYDRQSWGPDLARRHLEEEFGVTYSRPHVRRLLRAADAHSETATGPGRRGCG